MTIIQKSRAGCSFTVFKLYLVILFIVLPIFLRFHQVLAAVPLFDFLAEKL